VYDRLIRTVHIVANTAVIKARLTSFLQAKSITLEMGASYVYIHPSMLMPAYDVWLYMQARV